MNNQDEHEVSLYIANKKITDLEDDIRRLKDELKCQKALLSSYKDVALEQSRKIISLDAALQDTIPWDPSTYPRPSSSSTLCHQSPWTEVVVRRPRAASPSECSNRYAVLAEGSPVLADAPVDPCAAASPPLAAGDSREARHLNVEPESQQPSSRAMTSSSRRWMLREAVRRRSGFPSLHQALSSCGRGGLFSPLSGSAARWPSLPYSCCTPG